jgi:hypothetical protein
VKANEKTPRLPVFETIESAAQTNPNRTESAQYPRDLRESAACRLSTQSSALSTALAMAVRHLVSAPARLSTQHSVLSTASEAMRHLPPPNSPYSQAFAKIRGRHCNPCSTTFPTRAALEQHQQDFHRVKFVIVDRRHERKTFVRDH